MGSGGLVNFGLIFALQKMGKGAFLKRMIKNGFASRVCFF